MRYRLGPTICFPINLINVICVKTFQTCEYDTNAYVVCGRMSLGPERNDNTPFTHSYLHYSSLNTTPTPSHPPYLLSAALYPFSVSCTISHTVVICVSLLPSSLRTPRRHTRHDTSTNVSSRSLFSLFASRPSCYYILHS